MGTEKKLIWTGTVDEFIMAPLCRVIETSHDPPRIAIEKQTGTAQLGEPIWARVSKLDEVNLVLMYALRDLGNHESS